MRALASTHPPTLPPPLLVPLPPRRSPARRWPLQKPAAAAVLSLSGDLESMVDNAQFSDVEFVVDGRTVHAHKFILFARSEYFRRMFTSGYRESTDSTIAIPDVRAPIPGTVLSPSPPHSSFPPPPPPPPSLLFLPFFPPPLPPPPLRTAAAHSHRWSKLAERIASLVCRVHGWVGGGLRLGSRGGLRLGSRGAGAARGLPLCARLPIHRQAASRELEPGMATGHGDPPPPLSDPYRHP